MKGNYSHPVKVQQRLEALARALLIYRPYHARLVLRKFRHWLRVVEAEKEALAAEKARTIKAIRSRATAIVADFGRYWWGRQARRRVAALREARRRAAEHVLNVQESRLMAEEEKLTRRFSPELLHRQAVMIQCSLRSSLARRRLQVLLAARRHEASLCITAFVRRCALANRRILRAHQKRLRKERAAATVIQCAVRCHFARKAVVAARRAYRRRMYLKIFDDEDKVVEFYFTQNGAALRIQRWFHNLPWRRQLVMERKRARWAKKHPVVVEKTTPKKSALGAAQGVAQGALAGLAAGFGQLGNLVTRPPTPENMFSLSGMNAMIKVSDVVVCLRALCGFM